MGGGFVYDTIFMCYSAANIINPGLFRPPKISLYCYVIYIL